MSHTTCTCTPNHVRQLMTRTSNHVISWAFDHQSRSNWHNHGQNDPKIAPDTAKIAQHCPSVFAFSVWKPFEFVTMIDSLMISCRCWTDRIATNSWSLRRLHNQTTKDKTYFPCYFLHSHHHWGASNSIYSNLVSWSWYFSDNLFPLY